MRNLPAIKKLKADEYISAEEARELVFYFIRWGEHSKDYLRNLLDQDVEHELAATNYKLPEVISQLQSNPHSAIKWFENLYEGDSWQIEVSPEIPCKHSTIVKGVTVSERDVFGHAVIRQAHRADFIAACEARDRAIKEVSFDQFYTAIAKGFSSLEAYFTLMVTVHNSKCSLEDKLEEKKPRGGFVTFEIKLREWLPKITGVKLDFSSPGWNDFVYLRQIRNDIVIHPKPNAGLSTIEELADAINRFRYGVASLMFILHQAFNDPIQSSIIRAMRYPVVRVVKDL